MRDAEAAKDGRPQDDWKIDYTIEPIGSEDATAFIRRYEWMGTPGHPVASYCARNEFNEVAAVALFSRPPNLQSAGLCRALDPKSLTDDDRAYIGTVVCLERGACSHWAHPHTASWFIPRVLELARAEHGWKIVYAYSDEDAGEIGTIYQACNWLYIGQGVGRRPSRPRHYFRHRDWPATRKSISERAFYRRGFGAADIAAGEWIRSHHVAKHKYVQFVGDRRERRALLRELRYAPQPYPKRSPEIGSQQWQAKLRADLGDLY
jgi:hypothetical protein